MHRQHAQHGAAARTMDDGAGDRPARRAHLGRDRRAALRPRLPARLPADRQPPRRRGPHPGGLRPGLPLAVDLHPRHLRGLAAPDHHQPLPRPGPPQAADPLRRALRRAGGPADQRLPGPDAAYADRTFDDDVERALATLPPDFRAAVVLCDVEGLSYEEIAEILDAKLGTVRSRIHRGRAHAARGARPTAPRPQGRTRYSGPAVPARRPGPAAGGPRVIGHLGPAGQRAARRPAVRGRRRSGPGSTCTPATSAATSSSARAG